MMNEEKETPLADDVIAGQAVYTDKSLRYYDLLVLTISNRWIWKCPTHRILKLYNESISNRHLDVGVGTGYFLDRCRFPDENPEITLLDLNEFSLKAAAARISRYSPQKVVANILESLSLGDVQFDSVGLNYLLHCIPGDLTEKSKAFDYLLPFMTPGGVIFGATLLTHGVKRGFAARKLMAFYNSKGIFHNTEDRLADLETELNHRFAQVEIEIVGCAALFRAVIPD